MNYFPYKSQGYIKPVEGFWILLTCDPEIIRLYCWLAKSWGIPIEAGSRHGPHISVVKGEKAKNYQLVKSCKGMKFNFRYSNVVRDNRYHAWLDVKSPELSQFREDLGLPPKPYHSFHLTIGRLRYGIDHEAHEIRPKNLRKKLRRK